MNMVLKLRSNNRLLSGVTLNTNHFIRAVAITLVVAHHAHGSVFLAGGMNVLMLMAGLNLAVFSFGKPSKELVADIWNLIRKIVVPAICLSLVSFIYYGKFEITELLMVSNWYTWKSLSLYPIWYVQTLLQMMLILSILFLATNYSAWLMQSPVKVTLITFLVFLAVQLVSMSVWDNLPLRYRLPNIFLWNFTLGWVLWAFIGRGDLSTKNRTFATLVMIFGVAAVYLNPQWQKFTEPRIFNIVLLASMLIWLPSMKVPLLFKIVIELIAKSILFIFLGHLFVFEFFAYVFSFGVDENMWRFEAFVRFIVAMLFGIVLWVVSNSAMLAFRKTRLEMVGKNSV